MRTLMFCVIAVTAVVAAPAASADDLTGLEMRAVHSQGTPNDASTKVLALPEEASDTAREHAQKGLDTANSAREDGAAFGEGTAAAARDGHGQPEDPGRP